MRKLFLSLFLLCPQLVFGWCCGRIEGVVENAKTKELLPYVYIVIKNTSMWTTTDENGKYVIDAIPCVGEYEIVATLAGYHTEVEKVKLYPAVNVLIDFDLSKTAIQSGDVVLTDPKSLVLWETSNIYIDVVNKQELEEANIETVGEAIRWLTGIDVQKGAGWSKRVAKCRGLPSEDILVLLNGQVVSGASHLSGEPVGGIDLDHYPVEMLERIEVAKGPYSNLYGNGAMAGVINIITQSPDNINFGEYAFGTYNTKIHKLRQGIKRTNFGYVVNYACKESDGLNRSITQFDASDFNARVEFNLKPNFPKQVATLIIDPGYYYQNDVNQSREQRKLRINTIGIFKPHEFAELQVRASIYHWRLSYPANSDTGIMGDKNNEDDGLFEGEIYYTRIAKDAVFNATHRANIGYHLLRETYSSPQVESRTLLTHSCLFQDEMQFEKFSLVFSDRVDNYSQWDIRMSPKLALLYKAGKNFNLRLSVGKTFRNPSLVQLYSKEFYMPGAAGSPDSGMYIVGDTALKTEKALNYQLSAEYIFPKILVTRATLFRNDLDNMIALYTVDEDYQFGKPLKSYKNVEKAYTQGVELEVRTQILESRLSGTIGYTFLDTKDETTGDKLLSGEPAGNLTHKTTLILNFTEPKYKFGINLSAEYMGIRDSAVTLSVKDYIGAHMVHCKFYKDITKYARVFVSADNIFNKRYEGNEEIPETRFLSGLSINF